MKLIPTILCGGAVSRLWSVPQEIHPEPFIRLTFQFTKLEYRTVAPAKCGGEGGEEDIAKRRGKIERFF